MRKSPFTTRFAPVLTLAFAITGCPSVVGADFDHPNANAPADGSGGDSPAPPEAQGDAGTTKETDDASAPPCSDCTGRVPSNGAAFGALPLQGKDLTVATSSSFDTSEQCNAGSILGDCTSIIQTEGPAVCICRSASLVVGDLTVKGARALALLVQGTVTIAGTLDLAATGEQGGPGAEPAPTMPADSGLFVHGTNDLVPLRGGAAAIDGSQGGGALQISAGTSIAVEPKGTIQAGGGGGLGRIFAGGNGGSGGAILLEAPLVKIEGQLLANGGGGGGGGDRHATGGDGQDARNSGRNQALGGAGNDGDGCALNGYTHGGDGGWGAVEGGDRLFGQAADSRNCIPNGYVEAGGTGGRVGRIRINTSTSANRQIAPTSFLSPKASTGTLPFK